MLLSRLAHGITYKRLIWWIMSWECFEGFRVPIFYLDGIRTKSKYILHLYHQILENNQISNL